MSDVETVVETKALNIHVMRQVFRSWYGGENWTKYVILPRDYVDSKLKAYRRKYGDREADELVATYDLDVFCYSYYRGAGQPYANEPHVYRVGDRWVVFTQSGGWDI